jgi:IS5 family transposase
MTITGRSPGTIVGDRRFGTLDNDKAMAGLGVARVGLQRGGTVSKTRAAHERTRAFQRMRNWRVGVEARISHLKRGFGCGAHAYGAWMARRLGLAWGSLPTTSSG